MVFIISSMRPFLTAARLESQRCHDPKAKQTSSRLPFPLRLLRPSVPILRNAFKKIGLIRFPVNIPIIPRQVNRRGDPITNDSF